MNKILAYHFTSDRLRDGTPIPAIGHKLVFKGNPILCVQGLHASLHPFDALQYAPGPFLHRVKMSGKIVYGEDKLVATERTIVKSIDATEMLRLFARQQALSVLHLWPNAPAVVKKYLETGDESLRDAARDAAWAAGAAAWAAGAAAGDAAWAAGDAAGDAARAAAGYAAWAAGAAARAAAGYVAWAAGAAAGDAAWDAAGDAAWAAARAAAWAAAWAAARAAAGYAAWAAARDAKIQQQREQFLQLVNKEMM